MIRKPAVSSVDLLLTEPVLMVIGGSLGAASVNDHIRKILPELLKDFQVIHLCGKGKMDETLKGPKVTFSMNISKKNLPGSFCPV